MNSGHTYSWQTGENPSYRGGWCKIGWYQEGRNEPAFPNPGLARVNLILGPTPLNRVRPLPPNDNPLTKLVLDTRSGCRQGVVMRRSCLLQMVLKLTSAGERRTKTLRGPRQNRHQEQTWWNKRETSSHAYSIW